MSEIAAPLAEVRAALVAAVARDSRRRRRIRLTASVGAAALLLGVLASGPASGTGWLFGSPAPPRVAKDLHRFEKQMPPPHHRVKPGPGVPLGHPTAVARAGGYTLYLLRTAEHECYEVEPNGGSSCGPLESGPAAVEIIGTEVHADPRVKDDPRFAGRYGGGVLYGRTSASDAATVEVRIPGTPDPVTATVNPSTGYFLGFIDAADGTVLLGDGTQRATSTAVVRNAAGRIVARALAHATG